jgi:predicted MFS family arabinose efflux permease
MGLSFVLGIGLYGLTLVYPLYLGRVRGYDALMIGETMFVSGLAMFLTAPVAGRLVAKVDQRFMLMFGFICFAMFCTAFFASLLVLSLRSHTALRESAAHHATVRRARRYQRGLDR